MAGRRWRCAAIFSGLMLACMVAAAAEPVAESPADHAAPGKADAADAADRPARKKVSATIAHVR
ncbi:MAG: hypothetical protein EBR23_12070, partial [Planctomycetia bacterium]|nr:hypothetical protein [Planctomycetia bacterium]